GHPFLCCSVDDLIVHIREVPDESHGVSAELQVVPKHFEDHGAACMTEMAFVIHSYSAGIHPHVIGDLRLEDLLASGQRVMKLEHVTRCLSLQRGSSRGPALARPGIGPSCRSDQRFPRPEAL